LAETSTKIVMSAQVCYFGEDSTFFFFPQSILCFINPLAISETVNNCE